jgi:hypothetical protein
MTDKLTQVDKYDLDLGDEETRSRIRFDPDFLTLKGKL